MRSFIIRSNALATSGAAMLRSRPQFPCSRASIASLQSLAAGVIAGIVARLLPLLRFFRGDKSDLPVKVIVYRTLSLDTVVR